MRIGFKVAAGLLSTILPGQVFGQSYSLSGDWNGVTNPNGVWSYGTYQNGAFQSFGTGNGTYGVTSGAFIYQNTGAAAAYGIDSGQVSMEADSGTPDVRFVASTAGMYRLHVAVGGTTAYENGGYGNLDAPGTVLLVNGVSIPDTSAANNVYGWDLSQTLSAGGVVDVYVPQHYNGGNTQAIFTASVPEPTSAACIIGGMVALSTSRRRRTRQAI